MINQFKKPKPFGQYILEAMCIAVCAIIFVCLVIAVAAGIEDPLGFLIQEIALHSN